MKTFSFMNSARITAGVIAAGGLLVACSGEFSEKNKVSAIKDGVVYTFEAVQADSKTGLHSKSQSGPASELNVGTASTRTVISNETAVYWSPKDTIKIFYGSRASGKFISTNKEPVASTTFSGKFSGPGGTITVGEDSVDFWGLYPYDEDAVCDGQKVTIALPSSQTAEENTFASGLFPALAKSSGPSLAFYNICGGVMFTVSQSDITSVIFRGNNGESLAGGADVAMDSDGKPEVRSINDGKSAITVTTSDGTSFKTGVKYFIVAFPASLSEGYSITFNKLGSTATYTSSSAVTIGRSGFGKLEGKDSGLTFEPISGNIVFADNIAKSACVAKYDTDSDGELSYAEAAAVTSLENLFSGYAGVTSFEELEYFVNVTDLKGAFKGCTSLTTVTIPANITSIGDNAFYGCTSLETLAVPNTVTALGANAFSGCSSLDEITLPSSVTSIGSNCFGSDMNTVYMLGNTPPTVEEDSFDAATLLYVPASALEDYQSGWASYKDNIRAMFGGANCFVISSYSQHFFDASRKGNSEESVGEAVSAEVLWESFCSNIAPSVGDIVSDVSYRDGKVFFTASGKDGNAVIAVKDAAGNILWSWHIWVCKDFDPDATSQEYNNNAGTMMDRNLGALSATPGDVRALGLLYQWGRKDPFLGNDSIQSSNQYGNSAASTIEWPTNTDSKASNGTIAYSIANPTRFISYNQYNNDWYYTGTIATDNTRWQNIKTMYDPCPSGWRVPEGGEDGVWAKAFGSSSEFSKKQLWDSTNRGMNFGSGNGMDSSMQLGEAETIWYPATGCRSYNTSGVKYPGSNGYCWTTTPADADTAACCFFIDPTGKVNPSRSKSTERAAGRSVRCIKE